MCHFNLLNFVLFHESPVSFFGSHLSPNAYVVYTTINATKRVCVYYRLLFAFWSKLRQLPR